MNGPDHYRRAEELLAEVATDDGGISFGDGGEEYVAVAHVHAILALTAATALTCPERSLNTNEAQSALSEWSLAVNGQD